MDADFPASDDENPENAIPRTSYQINLLAVQLAAAVNHRPKQCSVQQKQTMMLFNNHCKKYFYLCHSLMIDNFAVIIIPLYMVHGQLQLSLQGLSQQ